MKFYHCIPRLRHRVIRIVSLGTQRCVSVVALLSIDVVEVWHTGERGEYDCAGVRK